MEPGLPNSPEALSAQSRPGPAGDDFSATLVATADAIALVNTVLPATMEAGSAASAKPGAESTSSCRYCFGGPEDGELVAPCACVGGQRWVHLACLRRWQHSVLADQPPKMAHEFDDARAARCNVCLGHFSYAPPSRLEVLVHAVGKQLAEMAAAGGLVVASPRISLELQLALRTGWRRRSIVDFVHWSHSVYLVHGIGKRQLVLAVPDEGSRIAAQMLVDAEGLITLHGRRFQLLRTEVSPASAGYVTPASPAPTERHQSEQAHVHTGSEDRGGLWSALMALAGRLPAQLRLEAEVADPDGAEDAVLAVNLSRPIGEENLSDASAAALRAARLAAEEAAGAEAIAAVPVRHFLGGPCSQESCLVLGRLAADSADAGCPGWREVEDAEGGFAGCPRPPPIFHPLPGLGGQLASGGDLARALVATALSSLPRLEADGYADAGSQEAAPTGANEDGVGTSPAPACKRPRLARARERGGLAGQQLTLLLFWGEARWSRTQLLAEAARGDWGFCHLELADLDEAAPGELWRQLTGSSGAQATGRRPRYAPSAGSTAPATEGAGVT